MSASNSTACGGLILALVLSGCLGGQTTDTEVSEQLTNQEIAGLPSSQTTTATPKRRPDDPIYVNLAPTVLDKKLRRTEKPSGAIGQHIRHEFLSDPIIQLLPEPKSKIGRKTSLSIPRTADVEVASTVSMREVMRLSGKMDKPGKTIDIVFEATVTSQLPAFSFTVVESGPVLQRMAISKRFAHQIREIIVEKIGPEIPAR